MQNCIKGMNFLNMEIFDTVFKTIDGKPDEASKKYYYSRDNFDRWVSPKAL